MEGAKKPAILLADRRCQSRWYRATRSENVWTTQYNATNLKPGEKKVVSSNCRYLLYVDPLVGTVKFGNQPDSVGVNSNIERLVVRSVSRRDGRRYDRLTSRREARPGENE